MLDLDKRGNRSWYETPPSCLLIIYVENMVDLKRCHDPRQLLPGQEHGDTLGKHKVFQDVRYPRDLH